MCDYTTYSEIPALGHDLVHHEAKSATCTEIGWNAYDTCSRCDYTTYSEIASLGHDLVHHEAKAATCTEIGWNAYDTCSRCDYTTYAEIASLGHNYENTGVHDGYYVYVCSRCQDSYSEETEGTLSLSASEFKTAWGLDFDFIITGSQVSGEGGTFTLKLDPLCVSLKKISPATDVTATVEGDVISVTVTGKVNQNEELIILTLTTSDELASGSFDFISSSAESSFPQMTIYRMGDVNMDGNVNSRDVTMIKQYTVRMITLTDAQLVYANVYVDTAVNSRDAMLIMQKVVRMEVNLGDRVNVTFVEGENETVRTVHKGSTLETVPAVADGYAWSESNTVYLAPVYADITADKKYYLVKREG